MTKPYALHRGDVLDVLRTMPDNSVDSIVTDPPYELGFMGKSWDASGIAYNVDMWREALRVLKPGGHLLAFSGSRTYHRMAVAIEDAGFDIRDQIMWVYGSGFPKSLDVSKAIDKAAGAEREVLSEGKAVKRMIPGADQNATGSWIKDNGREYVPQVTAPSTEAAKQWEGWGTALKPAHEPICVARKPLVGTVAANVLEFGTGALNIDGCRVAPTGERLGGGDENGKASKPDGWARPWMDDAAAVAAHNEKVRSNVEKATELGRWPANLIHDGSPEVVALFPDSNGSGPARTLKRSARDHDGWGMNATGGDEAALRDAGTGSAARFFYCAKASRADRNEGLEDPGPQFKRGTTLRDVENMNDKGERKGNYHPTVKPTDLMRYLVRLVTPPGGTVLDLFFGSGTTGKASVGDGFKFIGIDKDEDENGQPAGYLEIATARIEHELAKRQAAEQAALRAAEEAASQPQQLSLLA